MGTSTMLGMGKGCFMVWTCKKSSGIYFTKNREREICCREAVEMISTRPQQFENWDRICVTERVTIIGCMCVLKLTKMFCTLFKTYSTFAFLYIIHSCTYENRKIICIWLKYTLENKKLFSHLLVMNHGFFSIWFEFVSERLDEYFLNEY